MLCKKCHTEMTVMQEDNVNGLICPKCGWNIVTTKIDDIMLDTQLYCIWRILTAGFAEQNGRNAKLNGRITFDY